MRIVSEVERDGRSPGGFRFDHHTIEKRRSPRSCLGIECPRQDAAGTPDELPTIRCHQTDRYFISLEQQSGLLGESVQYGIQISRRTSAEHANRC